MEIFLPSMLIAGKILTHGGMPNGLPKLHLGMKVLKYTRTLAIRKVAVSDVNMKKETIVVSFQFFHVI